MLYNLKVGFQSEVSFLMATVRAIQSFFLKTYLLVLLKKQLQREKRGEKKRERRTERKTERIFHPLASLPKWPQ